jgi:aspartate/methionine/tyrosine aminotransferase
MLPCQRLLTAGLVIPGDAFGLAKGCHLRVAYGALQPATVAEGIGRLVAGVQALRD